MGSFFNYVDKKRWVGDTENVNDMQIFLITVEEFIHQ